MIPIIASPEGQRLQEEYERWLAEAGEQKYIAYLRSKILETFHASHDQTSHGNWAHGGIPSNEFDALHNVDEQVRVSVEAMLRARRKVAPTYTDLFSQVAAGNEGRMIGLEFKFKKAEGVIGKIERKIRDKGIPGQLAAEGISDALRYTMAFSPDDYADGVKSAVKALQEKGVRFLDFEDNWIRGDAYNGINAVFEDPGTGLKIELQFHTPESFNVKDRKIHQDYELVRERRGTTADRLRAFERMRRISDDVTFPEGFTSLCQEIGDPCQNIFRSKKGVI